MLKAISARLGADYYLFQTETSRNGFCSRYFWSQDKTDIVANAIGTDFSQREPLAAQESQKKIIFCPSAYYPHKNLEIIIRLADRFRDRNDIEFIVTTLEDSKFNDKIVSSGLSNLYSIGPYSYADAYKLYSQANVIIQPSLLETFSTTYIEAIALSKPLIAADTEFSREICIDYAIYYDSENIDSAVAAVEQALANSYTVDPEARMNVLNKYGTQEQRYERIKAIFNKVISDTST